MKEETNKSYVSYATDKGMPESKAKEYWKELEDERSKQTGKSIESFSDSDWEYVMGSFKKIVDNYNKKHESFVTTKSYLLEDVFIKANTKITIL